MFAKPCALASREISPPPLAARAFLAACVVRSSFAPLFHRSREGCGCGC